MPAAVKPVKVVFITFGIIAAFTACLFLAACGLRAAQSGDANMAPFTGPPLAPGAARDAARQNGRAVVRLISERDGTALFARYAPGMAAEFPLETVQKMLDQGTALQTKTPVGEIVIGKETAPGYAALLTRQNGDGSIWSIVVVFDSARADKISGLYVSGSPKSTIPAGVVPQGRMVGNLVAKNDVDGLYALFAPNMVKALPKAKIAEVLKSLTLKEKPIGARLDEIALPLSDKANGPVLYVTDFTYGKSNALKIVMTFETDTQKITSLRFVPSLPATLPPDPHANYHLKTRLRLPFVPGDKWTIAWGGDTRAQNYHVDYADQRHAFDILAVKDGKTHEGDGKQLSQYFAWGRKIVAPADAVVSEAVDGLPDNAVGKMDSAHAGGNHVVLNLGNNEYALLAHLQNGSIKVKTGQKVKAGDLLGLCGNSGNTSEPHLHFHVQDGPQLFHAKGLPVTFTDYVSNGKLVASGSPVQKEVVEAKP